MEKVRVRQRKEKSIYFPAAIKNRIENTSGTTSVSNTMKKKSQVRRLSPRIPLDSSDRPQFVSLPSAKNGRANFRSIDARPAQQPMGSQQSHQISNHVVDSYSKNENNGSSLPVEANEGFSNFQGYDANGLLPAHGARMSRYDLNKTVVHEAPSSSNYGPVSSSIDFKTKAKPQSKNRQQWVKKLMTPNISITSLPKNLNKTSAAGFSPEKRPRKTSNQNFNTIQHNVSQIRQSTQARLPPLKQASVPKLDLSQSPSRKSQVELKKQATGNLGSFTINQLITSKKHLLGKKANKNSKHILRASRSTTNPVEVDTQYEPGINSSIESFNQKQNNTSDIKRQIADLNTRIKQLKKEEEGLVANKTSEESTIFNLESFRSRLMSRLSRDDNVIQLLGVIQVPEVFADPPSAFIISTYLRQDSDQDDQAHVKAMLTRYNATHQPTRVKQFLRDFMNESELDPELTVCFTTNNKMISSAIKNIQSHLHWFFTKSLNTNLFHIQLQQSGSQLIRSKDKIDYQMVMQNHFRGGTNALRELYAEQIKSANWANPSIGTFRGYLCTSDGFPIYLRQFIFISSLFPAKVYGLSHRYFEIEGREKLIVQSELQQLFPYKQLPAFDTNQTIQLIIDTLQRTVTAVDRCFQFVELHFLIERASMRPVVAKMESTLSEDTKMPESCLTALIFKIDHQVRRSFHLQPNTSVRYKKLFRDYWKKIVDQDYAQTEVAVLPPVSAFAEKYQHQSQQALLIKDQGRDSLVKLSELTESNMTVLPEEVCVVSIGSSESPEKRIRKEKALKRRRIVQDQQRAYKAFMDKFHAPDAELKTHKEYVEEQKKRMKAVYRIQRFARRCRYKKLDPEQSINSLKQHIEDRIKFKNMFRRCLRAYIARKAVKQLIFRRVDKQRHSSQRSSQIVTPKNLTQQVAMMSVEAFESPRELNRNSSNQQSGNSMLMQQKLEKAPLITMVTERANLLNGLSGQYIPANDFQDAPLINNSIGVAPESSDENLSQHRNPIQHDVVGRSGRDPERFETEAAEGDYGTFQMHQQTDSEKPQEMSFRSVEKIQLQVIKNSDAFSFADKPTSRSPKMQSNEDCENRKVSDDDAPSSNFQQDGDTIGLSKPASRIFDEKNPEQLVLNPNVLMTEFVVQTGPLDKHSSNNSMSAISKISPILETLAEQNSDETSSSPVADSHHQVSQSIGKTAQAASNVPNSNILLRSQVNQVSSDQLTKAGKQLSKHFSKKQTTPEQKTLNGHLHYVQDLESFEKLRIHGKPNPTPVTPEPQQHVPMSAQQHCLSFSQLENLSVVPETRGAPESSIVSSYTQLHADNLQQQQHPAASMNRHKQENRGSNLMTANPDSYIGEQKVSNHQVDWQLPALQWPDSGENDNARVHQNEPDRRVSQEIYDQQYQNYDQHNPHLPTQYQQQIQPQIQQQQQHHQYEQEQQQQYYEELAPGQFDQYGQEDYEEDDDPSAVVYLCHEHHHEVLKHSEPPLIVQRQSKDEPQQKMKVETVTNEGEKHSKPKVVVPRKVKRSNATITMETSQASETEIIEGDYYKIQLGPSKQRATISRSTDPRNKNGKAMKKHLTEREAAKKNLIEILSKDEESSGEIDLEELQVKLSKGNSVRKQFNQTTQASRASIGPIRTFTQEGDRRRLKLPLMNMTSVGRRFSQERGAGNMTNGLLSPIQDDELLDSSARRQDSPVLLQLDEEASESYAGGPQQRRHSRQAKQKSYDDTMRRMKYKTQQQQQISKVKSVKRIVQNTSQKELSKMFVPGHEEIGGEDWFNKMLMESNQKSSQQTNGSGTNSVVKNQVITAGIDTRTSVLFNTVTQGFKPAIKQPPRKSIDRQPTVTQTIAIVANLNQRIARQQAHRQSGRSLTRFNSKSFI